ncbi:probable rRNA-processing protein EBP2 homolog [Ctenocephalides felis]|uniref:probable rRNA-processing protein EBP2 homolog n=1 Tax=Ctenocephalides felis TaxID=7515 RepID=UPI000E6E3DF2|nr:probable rRNA-processing protein EBP2 homolog [Ctenocephalides felis]
MSDFEDQDDFTDSEDEELQQAFAEGKLKPGLNVVEEETKKVFVNNVGALRHKVQSFKQKLPWVECLDLVNEPAPLAPELAMQIKEHDDKREKQLKNNAKLAKITPKDDPVVNDFHREMLFHQQAQAAVIDGISRLKKLGVYTKRPEDYFAEMAKSDEHMQKVRKHLLAKQEGQAKSERMKQLREQRKLGKQLQVQAKVQRAMDKKEMLDQVKKYRKGQKSNLDFLDGNKNKPNIKNVNQRSMAKRKAKDAKFGFGGRKKGSKLNTKESAADVTAYRRPPKLTGKGSKLKGSKKPVLKRLGKSRRQKSKTPRGKN